MATRGRWERGLTRGRRLQYVVAAGLGALPGCMGGFTTVALFVHGRISFGALVAGMLATAGDESFVMFALIPVQAFWFHILLFGLGIGAGMLTDVFMRSRRLGAPATCGDLRLHDQEPDETPVHRRLADQWHVCSPARGMLALGLTLLVVGLAAGPLAPDAPTGLRLALAIGILLALAIVVTASDHFLEEHLWKHVVLRHLPRLFAWTIGTLAFIQFAVPAVAVEPALRSGRWLVLLSACLIGLIPESGPHLVFVMLYAEGALPLSVLLANSIVQDGHGALPLLAHSRRAFLAMKGANIIVGLVVGAALLAMGL